MIKFLKKYINNSNTNIFIYGKNGFCKALSIFCAIILLAGFTVLSCKSADNTSSGNFFGGNLTWVIEQRDASFWAGQLKGGGKMFINFFLAYKGNLKIDEIAGLTIESPADMWIIDAKDLHKLADIDDEKKSVSFRYLQCGEKHGGIALGDWYIAINFKNGAKFEKKINISGFDNMQTGGKNAKTCYIVPKSSLENQISALTLPVIKSVSRDEDSIEIFFSVNDNRVKNGYFWFDVPGEKYYKDSGSMIDGSGNPVNGCRKFSTDGNECRYILRKDDSNRDWFDKITDCFFVVSDTNRVSAPWEERIRSVSAKTKVN